MGLDFWVKVSGIEMPWVREYALILYDEFKDGEFTAEDAQKALTKTGRRIENIYKLLSPLLKEGLLQRVGEINGKTLYRFVIGGGNVTKTPGRDDLISLLKSAADNIRAAVPYESILLLLFYKVVSDKWSSMVSMYKRKGYTDEQAYTIANEYYLKLYDENSKSLLTWDEVTKNSQTIQNIEPALLRIVELNSTDEGISLEELRMVIDRVGFSALANNEDLRQVLVNLVELFNKYDFSMIDYDVIGDAYQWILSYFAPTKAKEGETYTPREVIRLMVRLMDPENNNTIVDPACGSAAMLIEAYNYVKAKLGGRPYILTDEEYIEPYNEKKESPALKLYGQDRNELMVAIAKMNLLLHGIKTDAKIFLGDSLTNPKFLKELGDLGADYVIANPPWNQDGYGEDKLGKPELRRIYKYGYPPNNTADWAWIQLMLYTARRKAVVVIDQGALFRGGKEGEVRSKIINEDLVEAVILLPEKLFYNTQAPGAILVFNKGKPQERRGKILFINASNEYKPHPEVRKLNILGEDNIDKITKTYRGFTEIPGFSRIVPIEEVRKYDYNLNVTLYVTPIGEEESIDLVSEWEELKRIEHERQELMNKVNHIMNEITKALGE
jgi:type I restriction enzyme M protein